MERVGPTITTVSQLSETRGARGIRSSALHLVVAAVLVLGSGAFMVWAGYSFAGGRIKSGLLITTPPGFTIEAAFLLFRRHDRAAGRSRVTLSTRVRQELVILLAGGVMVLAGYCAGTWNWLVGAPVILIGLPVILTAVWLGRQSPSRNKVSSAPNGISRTS
jgi:hypothetical protein